MHILMMYNKIIEAIKNIIGIQQENVGWDEIEIVEITKY